MLARRVLVATTAAATLALAPAALAGTSAPASDLSVSVETTSASVGLGEHVEFAISVQNQGPNAGGGTVKVRWDPGLSHVSEQRTGIGACSLSVAPRMSCPLDVLDPSASATMTLVLDATDIADQTVRVVVLGANQDPNPADDRDSVTVTVAGPLAGPTASPAVVRPGLSPSPAPSPTPSPTPSPIPSGGIQTGAGGTAGGRNLAVPAALSAAVVAAGALWLARRRRPRPRLRAGPPLP